MIGPTHRRLPDKTQQSQPTDIHAPSGIRTRNPSKRAAADPHNTPRGHRDRPVNATGYRKAFILLFATDLDHFSFQRLV